MILINPMGVTYAIMSADPVFRMSSKQPIKLNNMLRQFHSLPITIKYVAETYGIIAWIDTESVSIGEAVAQVSTHFPHIWVAYNWTWPGPRWEQPAYIGGQSCLTCSVTANPADLDRSSTPLARGIRYGSSPY